MSKMSYFYIKYKCLYKKQSLEKNYNYLHDQFTNRSIQSISFANVSIY